MKGDGKSPVRWMALSIGIAGGSWVGSSAVADGDVIFDRGFLRDGGQALDLARFEAAPVLPPGTQRLDTFVNQRPVGRFDVTIEAESEHGPARTCFRRDDLPALGLDLRRLPEQERVQHLLAADCVDLRQLDPNIALDVDVSALTAHLAIPQAYIGRLVRGMVDPQDWDEGITAGFVGYNASAFRNQLDQTGGHDRYYASLNAGLNVAGWRLRHNGTYSRAEQGSEYQAGSTYAQHDLTALKAQGTLGEYFTPGDLFDAMPFTGVALASDERMLPDSQRGFAPTVRGSADTNAQVSIRQAGNLVYQTTVAPGPFVIDDLYNTGYAGDLEVTITEADGREKTFTVPYASVSQLLRPGNSRFSLAAGRYRDDQLDAPPAFVQGTYRYGLSNDLTLYTGSTLAENYLAVLGGAALNTRFGALGADVTRSQASGLPTQVQGIEPRMRGQSYRLTYSERLDATGTNLAIAAYRFSSEGYLSMANFAALKGSDFPTLYRERNRIQLDLDQPLGDSLSLFVNGMRQNYWDRSGTDTTYQAGIGKTFGWGALSFSASRTRQGGGNRRDDEQTQYLATLSVPLSFGERLTGAYLRTSAAYTDSRDRSLQTSLSGSAGETGQFGYSLYQSSNRDEGQRGETRGGSLQYTTSPVALGFSASSGEGYSQYTASARGTVLGYGDGVLFSAGQGETMGVIEAAGGKGARVGSGHNSHLDGQGKALVTGLSPYRRNEVLIDPKGASDDVEFKVSSQVVTPRQGAVVKLDYPTTIGRALLLQVSGEDGGSPPFGAEVLSAAGESLGMIGQAGLALLRIGDDPGPLQVRWGGEAGQSCRLVMGEPIATDSPGDMPRRSARCLAGA
ncbi:outer membrane usher protein [Pseudomonas knackmussii B13]|uniref:Outer membrane usher protein n=1 Tax=Pseudomonas knackmussii (strain DSM 6978 / CCUG 54928 / LMG 23759 / B13) TaxID=1301098 RepID=A0A024HFJ3_PSEKB|nr:outer membrane usher protein [Pseudomonas knackmussii B13]